MRRRSNLVPAALHRWVHCYRDAADLAFAAGRDAANRSMRRAGRTAWNEEDGDVCTATTNAFLEELG